MERVPQPEAASTWIQVAIVVVKMTKDVDGLLVSETTFEKACPKKLNNEASSVSTDEVSLLWIGLDWIWSDWTLSVKERNGRGGSDS